ncbi:hypothetical protein VM1G_04181 [Cytospora mali]|uniref:Major facilitator superfamily (MFS) profile domain-containing protein n=1 Tax=Cytospora mali TaxID=578113 RepID=A0A194VX50_CYTMA|nr:hypothetical protein VM1G_04181 [Valsa mali]
MSDLDTKGTNVPSEGGSNTTPASRDTYTDRGEDASDNITGPNSDLERHHTHISRIQSIKQGLGERPECFKNTLQEVSFVAQATIAMSTSTFLNGAASIVTASIGRDLGMSQGEISWISAASTLTAGAFQLAVGQLSDLLGRKLVFLVGMGSFAVFVLLVGFSQNPFWMDIVMGVIGIACAMVVPPAGGILGAAYGKPSKRKNLAFSAYSAGNPTGFVFGSIACGIATRLFNWRAAFFFIAILWAVFFIHAFWAVPNVEAFDSSEPLKQRLSIFFKRFDTVGAILTLFGTGMFTAGITLGPADGWKSPVTLCLMLLGVVLIVLFGFWETKYPYPLMPPFIWKDKNFTLLMIVTALGFMAFQSSAFYLSYFMQDIREWDALTVAVHLLPQAIAGLLWNFLIGHTLHKINNTLIMIIGSLSYLVANLLLSLMHAESNYWAFIFPALILNVVGSDFQFNVANMYVMQSLPAQQQGLASGVMNTIIRLSSTVAMGIATAVFASIEISPQGLEQPMLKYTRTFQVSMAMAAASVLLAPFIKIGTQGNYVEEHGDDAAQVATTEKGSQPAGAQENTTKKQ